MVGLLLSSGRAFWLVLVARCCRFVAGLLVVVGDDFAVAVCWCCAGCCGYCNMLLSGGLRSFFLFRDLCVAGFGLTYGFWGLSLLCGGFGSPGFALTWVCII